MSIGSSRDLQALSVVLAQGRHDATDRLAAAEFAAAEAATQLAEAEEGCPALFASIGDCFEHRHDGPFCHYSILRYEGRTAAGEVPGAPAGWLKFRFVGGDGDLTNGGVRDVICAWPLSEYPRYDKAPPECHGYGTTITLPPSKVWAFRHERFASEEEEEEDEEGGVEED
jgi:hypothetical protein